MQKLETPYAESYHRPCGGSLGYCLAASAARLAMPHYTCVSDLKFPQLPSFLPLRGIVSSATCVMHGAALCGLGMGVKFSRRSRCGLGLLPLSMVCALLFFLFLYSGAKLPFDRNPTDLGIKLCTADAPWRGCCSSTGVAWMLHTPLFWRAKFASEA
jgi:hypothetical protein